MKILADAGIPHLEEGLAGLGDVVCADGRAIGREDVRDVDVLIVRTLTRVDEKLLDGSRVTFEVSAAHVTGQGEREERIAVGTITRVLVERSAFAAG